jgi:hypothetical protein
VLLQIRNVADRQIDRAIDLAEQSAAVLSPRTLDQSEESPRSRRAPFRHRPAAGQHHRVLGDLVFNLQPLRPDRIER